MPRTKRDKTASTSTGDASAPSGSKSKGSKSKGAAATATTDPTVEATRSQYLFFWKPEGEGGIYSQWWAEHPFTGTIEVPSTSNPGTEETITVTYPTAEHYMMAQKARLFNDLAMEKQILGDFDPTKAPDAKKTKALGRLVQNFNESTWNANRLRIVEEGNMLKFSQHEALKQQLLETKELHIVEASPMDRIWGVGFGAQKAPYNRSRWGLNLLGIAIMNVRKRLREEEQKHASTSASAA
jgi:ribA/ribD-fused uncharacterized protein